MRPLSTTSFLFLTLFSFSSCALKDNVVPSSVNDSTAGRVSIETALDSFYDFISDIDTDATKSSHRTILSINALSGCRTATRRQAEKDAYLVNFDDSLGFAILGAHSSVPSVIAFVEKGNISWDTILQSGAKEGGAMYSSDSLQPEQVLLMCLNGALFGRSEEKDTLSQLPQRISPITSNLTFDQYHTYCLNSSHHYVVNGCASTAIAIAVAHNNYPTIYADYEMLNLSNCNSLDGNGFYYYIDGNPIYLSVSDHFSNPLSVPTYPTNDQLWTILKKVDTGIWLHGTPTGYSNNAYFFRTRYKLTSSIFYLLGNSIIGWGSTGALPSAVKTGLENLGYTNVNMLQNTSLTSGFMADIVDMLCDDKPVIMCGWSLLSLANSHYWIVDGAGGSVPASMVHCNWGWNGRYNGWFSRNCLRKTAGLSYDDGSTPGTISDGNSWDNIVVFTYDKQVSTPSVSIHHLYDNKVIY